MKKNYRSFYLVLFFLSGIAGLIYEITWSRLLVFVFGGTTFAVTTVLSCFMGGLALGGFLGGKFSKKIKRPDMLYGILEVCIGIVCLFIPYLFDLSTSVYRLLVRNAGDSFFFVTVCRVIISTVILIVPTTFMGATLPVLTKAFVTRASDMGKNIGHLYGINTVGAFLGCVLAGFFLIPVTGLGLSIRIAVSLNLVAGLSAIVYARRMPLPDIVESMSSVDIPQRSMTKGLVLSLYFFSGAAAMIYQVSWTRALILSIGASTYAFSAVVACFIFGIAVGSLVLSRWIDRMKNPLVVAGLFEGLIGLSALLVVPFFGRMPLFVDKFTLSGSSFGTTLSWEMLYVFALLIVPTFCMGALMPLVCKIYDPDPLTAGESVGEVYSFNTAGTIAGTLLAGFLLIPHADIGMQRTITIASVISGIIGTFFILFQGRWKRPVIVAAVLAAWITGIIGVNMTGPWSKEVMLSASYLGNRITDFDVLFYEEGVDTTVAVTSSGGETALRVNGKVDASTGLGDLYTQYLIAHIPLFLAPDAKDLCVIGLGSGATVGASLAYPVNRVDVAEISSSVIEAARFFEPVNNNVFQDKRVRIHRTDGRNFLLLNENKYDIIISEPSNPWISGIGNLYTREFFKIAKSRIKPGGIHAQWVHGYSIGADNFVSIVRTLRDVFDHVQVWEMGLHDYLLVASEEPLSLDIERLYMLFSEEDVADILSKIYINDPMQVANHYINDGSELLTWEKGDQLITDDLPILEFSAPYYMLNKRDQHWIRNELNNSKGLPLLSGDTSAPLNKEFLDHIEMSRKKNLAIQNAIMLSAEKDLNGTLDNLLEVAKHNGNDMRALEVLSKSKFTTRDPEQYQRIKNTFSKISGYVRNYNAVINRLGGKDAVLYWPFSRKTSPASVGETRLREIRDVLSRYGIHEALQRADKILEKAPDSPDILLWAGKRSLEAGMVDRSIAYLLKGWLMVPDETGYAYHLARAFSARGAADKAFFFLEKAVVNSPGNRERALSDPLFVPLRKDGRFDVIFHKS